MSGSAANRERKERSQERKRVFRRKKEKYR